MMPITLLSVAKKNIRRRIFRSIAIILSVAVVAGTIFSVTTVMESVERSIKKGTGRLGADIMVVPREAETKARTALLAGEPSTFYMDRSIEERIKNVRGVKRTAGQIFLQSSQYQCCDIGNLLLIGFDPEHDFTVMPWIASELDGSLSKGSVVMGRGLTSYEVGATIGFYGKGFKIVGMLEETGMKFIDNAVFMPYSAINALAAESENKPATKTAGLPVGKVSTVLVQVSPEFSAERVAIFLEHEIPGIKAIVSEHVISSVRRQLFVLIRSIVTVSILLWIMAILLIGVVFSMIVNERQREIGLIRAMGAKRKSVFQLLMLEASMLSVVGGLLGTVGGGVFLYLFGGVIRSSLNIPYLWPTPLEFLVLIGICFILSLFTGAVAAFYPAFRSMRMEPYEAIRKGE